MAVAISHLPSKIAMLTGHWTVVISLDPRPKETPIPILSSLTSSQSDPIMHETSEDDA